MTRKLGYQALCDEAVFVLESLVTPSEDTVDGARGCIDNTRFFVSIVAHSPQLSHDEPVTCIVQGFELTPSSLSTVVEILRNGVEGVISRITQSRNWRCHRPRAAIACFDP